MKKFRITGFDVTNLTKIIRNWGLYLGHHTIREIENGRTLEIMFLMYPKRSFKMEKGLNVTLIIEFLGPEEAIIEVVGQLYESWEPFPRTRKIERDIENQLRKTANYDWTIKEEVVEIILRCPECNELAKKGKMLSGENFYYCSNHWAKEKDFRKGRVKEGKIEKNNPKTN